MCADKSLAVGTPLVRPERACCVLRLSGSPDPKGRGAVRAGRRGLEIDSRAAHNEPRR